MKYFQTNKVIKRLDDMIEHAINGEPIETSFDETTLSALEAKFSKYLAMTQTTRGKLEDEKMKINELISDISHQTKTPIANILLYSQLLSESNLSVKDSQCVTALTSQAEKLNFLISALMKTSRLENGIIAVQPKPQNIMPMLSGVLTQVYDAAAAKQISVSYEEMDAFAVFDLKWTSEALFNILDNAIKYTPFGGTVSVACTPYPMFLKIDITDSGISISESDIPHIFQRFYRSQTVSEIEGVGIGLYLSREIISSQGGYIKVSSKENKGSTFAVFLPISNKTA